MQKSKIKNKKEQHWAIISYDLWIGSTSCVKDVEEENPGCRYIKITKEEWEKWENDKLHYEDIKDRPRYYAEKEVRYSMRKLKTKYEPSYIKRSQN